MQRVKVKPLYRQVLISEHPKRAAADIETEGLGGKFLDGCIKLEDRNTYYHFSRIDKMLQFFANHPQYEYYFHNGSGYDFSYFIPTLYYLMKRHKASVALIKQGQSRIIGMKVKFFNYGKSQQVLIKDSLPLLQMSLEKAADKFAPELPKLVGSIDWDNGEIYDPNNPVHVQYLHRDCDSLLAVIQRVESILRNTFGVSPGWTSGSTAIRAWKAHIPEGRCYYPLPTEVAKFCRLAYFGGYVFPGHDLEVHEKQKRIDFNGMFAAAQLKGVPVGAAIFDYEYRADRPGFWECVVRTPDVVDYPILPSRDTHGDMRWAVGQFRTYLSSLEINFALARGYHIDVIRGYWFERVEQPFEEFLRLCEKLEIELGGEVKELTKILRNAFYGKFGTKLEATSVEIRDDAPVDKGYRPIIDEVTGEMLTYLWEHVEETVADYIMPHWAAWITATARIMLFEMMEEIGLEHVHYTDTDSVTADGQAVDRVIESGYAKVAPGYGNIKVDAEFEWFQSVGSKNYRGRLADGRIIGKVKGIPRKAVDPLRHFLAAHGQDVSVEFDSVNTILSRVKEPSLPIATTRTRTIGTLTNSKSWVVTEDGRIVPVRVKE